MGVILLCVLVFMLFLALPQWKYSRNWGYIPSSLLGSLLLLVLVLLVLGYIPRGF